MRNLLTQSLILSIWLGMTLINQSVHSQECDPVEVQKLVASDGSSGDEFGISVSVDGTTAVIGARHDADGGTDSGSAYVFEKSGELWIEVAKLTASDAAPHDLFGSSVGVSGDTVIVGSPFDYRFGLETGSAYVFERVNEVWVEAAKLIPVDGEEEDEFGCSVAVSGDIVLVGAKYNDAPPFNSGAAYVFERIDDEWVQTAKLAADDAFVADHFGTSVSLSGTTAVIGAPLADGLYAEDGVVYAFERIGAQWVQTAKLGASDGTQDDRFGASVSIHNDLVIIGAPHVDRFVTGGAAYTFERIGSEWIQTTKLTPSHPAELQFFGSAVAAGDNSALIGAYHDDTFGSWSGTAYFFEKRRNRWLPAIELNASDEAPYDQFGAGVAISGDVAGIGAYWDDDRGNNSGSLYRFDLNCGPSLRVLGSCPGRMGFEITGATSDGRVALLYARGEGSFEIPPGNPCSGTVLGLNRSVQLGDVLRADENGAAILETRVSARACGQVFVQAVDLETCAVTNVAPVQ